MDDLQSDSLSLTVADDQDTLTIRTHEGAQYRISVWKCMRWVKGGLRAYYEQPEEREFSWNTDVELIAFQSLATGNGWSWIVGVGELQLRLILQVKEGPNLYFSLQSLTDSDDSPNISWPDSLEFIDKRDSSIEELYLPYCQGFVMAASRDSELKPMIADTNCGPGQSLPFMGVRNLSGAGWMIHSLTSDDCAFEIASSAGTGIEARQIWRPSLGRLRYPRKCVITVFDKADGNIFAKTYKKRIQDGPLWKTLAEKTDENPRLLSMKGAPYCFLAHYPYEERVEDIRSAWTFLQKTGYANALFGPCPRVRLQKIKDDEKKIQADARTALEALEKSGALVFNWLLPNLMDRRLPEYSDAIARKEADGTVIPGWETGHQKLNPLCPLLQEESAQMHWESINKIGGHHFDTTAMEALHECWSSVHPCSRTHDRICRERLVGRVTMALGHFALSEAGCEWAVPHFHMLPLNNFGHHIINSGTGWQPIPFPLFSLAYRECVLSCWHETDTWHDSCAEDKRLHDSSIGAVPTFNPCGKMFLLYDGKPDPNKSEFHTRRSRDPEVRKIIESGLDVAALADATWGLELESFEYLDDAKTVSESKFTNGPTVLVNRSQELYKKCDVTVAARQFVVQ